MGASRSFKRNMNKLGHNSKAKGTPLVYGDRSGVVPFEDGDKAVDFNLISMVEKGATRVQIDKIAEIKYGLNSRDVAKKYIDALISKRIAKSKGDLLKMNLIDLREYLITKDAEDEVRKTGNVEDGAQIPVDNMMAELEKFNENSELIDACKQDGICSVIPCFEKGVMRISRNGYVYWEIVEINLEEQDLRVYLEFYSVFNDAWKFMSKGVCRYHFKDGAVVTDGDTMESLYFPYQIFHEDYQSVGALYKLHDVDKDPAWSEKERTVFNSVVRMAAIKEDIEAKKSNTDMFRGIASTFGVLTYLVNLNLRNEKVRTERKSGKRKGEACEQSELNTNKRRIRYVGKIRVKSDKTPKLPTEESVVKYKTPIWHARGGVRHMKDGRVIPFKESVHHRKCLMEKFADQEFTVPQSVIRIRPNGEE